MRKLQKLFIMFMLAIIMSSCYTWNIHKYSISNLDGKGKVDNANFSVSYGDDFTVLYDAEGTFTIRNNKDSILYIDMGNSYFLDAEGQAERLFTNTVQTTYTSTTTGTSFNLGSVARVLGAGPITSTLAGGVSVGSATTSGTAVQQIEDRYIGIPPYATVKIKFPFLGRKESFNKKTGVYNYNRPSESQVLSYTYSSENPKWKMIRNQFVLDEIVVQKNGKISNTTGNSMVVVEDPNRANQIEIECTSVRNEVNYYKLNAVRIGLCVIGGIAIVTIPIIVIFGTRH